MCNRALNMSDNALNSHCNTTLLGPDNRVFSSYLPDGTLMARHFVLGSQHAV